MLYSGICIYVKYEYKSYILTTIHTYICTNATLYVKRIYNYCMYRNTYVYEFTGIYIHVLIYEHKSILVCSLN